MNHKDYVCATCAQDFTRKSSANRHNANLHQGRAVIVRFLDYIVGRVTGLYHAADPRLYSSKANRNGHFPLGIGNNKYTPSSFADTVGEAVANYEDRSDNSDQLINPQTGGLTSNSGSLHDTLDLAIKFFELKKLANEIPRQPIDGITLMSNFIRSLLRQSEIFGFVGYVCPSCAYWTVYQLEFGKTNWLKRMGPTDHNCPGKPGPENRDDRMLPFFVSSLCRAWLNDEVHLLTLRLPPIISPNQAILLQPNKSDPSRSILLPNLKGAPIVLESPGKHHWSTKAIANEKKWVSISTSELQDFLQNTGQATYGIFRINVIDGHLDRRQNEHLYFICVGRLGGPKEPQLQPVQESV